ncbi:arylesterase [Mucilaginibacter sp.]|uniref:arylesterase n=1 Tax=Mucilaginibacter sp. TaxID=1882438 RepID=UPI0025CC9EFD|nr:arylesterase [Mucilaginibacter sp.]
MQNILFFGDSLTAGYGLANAAAESFPAIIGQKITAAGLGYRVVNAGLSGDTSAGGLQRIDYWLNQPVSVFVLELGINDVIRGMAPLTTKNNLQTIIDKVKAKYPNAKMAIMGMQMPVFLHSPVAGQFMQIFTTLAAANNISLVPFFLDGVAGVRNLNLPDKLHPNVDGYKVIADNVWPVIQKLLL